MIYEYKCQNQKCGNEFEERRTLKNNSDVSECPECKGESKKIMSRFGFKIIGFSSLNGYSHANK